MKARLFTIPASHPGWTARLMLERKGIPYSRIDLVAVALEADPPRRGLPRRDGAGAADRRPQGPGQPGDRPRARPARPRPAAVPRRPRGPRQGRGGRGLGRRGPPGRRPAARLEPAQQGPRPDRELPGGREARPPGRRSRRRPRRRSPSSRPASTRPTTPMRSPTSPRSPALLDRIDGYIADGVIGGAEPNAADLQIAPSVALLMTMEDLRPFIESRPAGELARRLVPDFPGHTPPGFPAGLARAAQRLTARSGPNGSTRSRVAERVEAVPEPGPVGQRRARDRARAAGRARTGARSPRGAAACSRSVSSSTSPSSSRSTSTGRGLWRGASKSRPASASTALQASSSSSGSRSVAIRTARLRKSGWSRISPTGSVS